MKSKSKLIRQIVVVAVIILIAFTASSEVRTTRANTAQISQNLEMNSFEIEVMNNINLQRAAAGLYPLRFAPVLLRDGRIRVLESCQLWSHTRPNGYAWYTVDPANMYGECLYNGYDGAPGTTNPNTVVAMWMNSPTHRDILMDPYYRSGAISAYVNGDKVYVSFEAGF